MFRYEVLDKAGKVTIGAMNASSEAEVNSVLTRKGYFVRAIFPATQPARSPKTSTHQTMAVQPVTAAYKSSVTTSKKELGIFFRQLAHLQQAGVGMEYALAQIGGRTPNRGMQIIATRMQSYIAAGGRLSSAMAEFPRAFPTHIVAAVSAGELAGILPLILGDLALDYELSQRASNVWAKWIAWIIWANTIGILLIMPFFRIILMGTSFAPIDMLRRFLWYSKYTAPPLILLVIGYHVALAYLKSPKMRNTYGKWVLRLPIAGRAHRERSLASFCRILARLQNAGILPLQAWNVASQVAENPVIAERLQVQAERLRPGSKLSDALWSTGLFSDDDLRVLESAEQSGETAQSFERVADYYEDAAKVSAGRSRWLGLYISWLGYFFTIALLFIVGALTVSQAFEWADKFMK